MQRKSVGHVSFKQGLQDTSLRTMMDLFPTGDVVTGLVEPKIATVGMFNAPAICINPESLLMNKWHWEIKYIDSRRVVFPARLIIFVCARL